jgi:hypothetical protein
MAVDEARERRRTFQEKTGMLPLYLARVEDLGQGDFVKVDCAACHYIGC